MRLSMNWGYKTVTAEHDKTAMLLSKYITLTMPKTLCFMNVVEKNQLTSHLAAVYSPVYVYKDI